jgi:cyclomaltodextrinase / maltogenic alpha-amylase / neopullulanase
MMNLKQGVLAGAALAAMLALPAGAGVRLNQRSCVVWGRPQTITGRVDSTMPGSGTLSVNGVPHSFQAAADTFAVVIRIGEGTTTIVASADSAGLSVSSDTLRLSLGFALRPEIFAHASTDGGMMTLRASVLENPDSAGLSFLWTADPRNRADIGLSAPRDSVSGLDLPAGLPFGEYRFTVAVAASNGDTVRARAMIVSDSSGVRPFDIVNERARWIDSAVVYGVTPSIFVGNGTLGAVTDKIPDLLRLGVNTLWIQPIYATHGGGQGYDVIDYFRVRPDIGSAADLRKLVGAAHDAGMRVLLDFIPNHSSIYHPYALDASANGTSSHYYDYYQRTADAAPYSQFYRNYQGFINYFWDELPNFNYDNPEVRRWITEAARYWVEQFDIDGYRVDAAWGPAARAPDFFAAWRLALKRVKPDLLLLAEDKATWPSVFDGRFDAAYDWAPEQSWVSHWSWQTSYSTNTNPTIFNYSNSGQRSSLLRTAMTNSGSGYAPNAKVFRFLENNDTFRFLATHDLARTKMAAALMFSIPGIPSIFNGQEIGASTHPYNTFSIFTRAQAIDALDTYGLFPFYSRMAAMRKKFPALQGNNFAEMGVTPGSAVYAYRRWEGTRNILAVVNMASSVISASVSVPVAQLGIDTTRTYFLSDQVNDQVMQVNARQLAPLVVQVPAFSTRIFVLDTVAVTSVDEPAAPPAQVPAETALLQNYPNPFNPSTTITFTVGGVSAVPGSRESHVRLAVYDLLGREVTVLSDGPAPAGTYSTTWNAAGCASGVYFCRLEAAGRTFVTRMLLLR